MNIFSEIDTFLAQAKQAGTKPLIVIVGPTASGKTSLSIKIAKKIDGEIISADSRQVYKYMDIGTDKLPPSRREGIIHHLIDIIDPNKEFSVSDFKRLASKAINEIHSKRKVPILCGGTGLYINAITQDYRIPDIPPDTRLRTKLERLYSEKGELYVHGLLRECDPVAAEKIHHNNRPYVIRALEICKAGTIKTDKKGRPNYAMFIIGIDWPREILYERINVRVDELMEKGLLNEVKTLILKGYNAKMPSLTSLGYLELIQFLNGHVTLNQAVEEIKKNTRNFCKRQITWFKRDKEIRWISGEELQKTTEC